MVGAWLIVLRLAADGLQCLDAQHIRIALAGLGQGDEFVGNGLLVVVVAVSRAQADAGQFERQTQSPSGLQVEIIWAFEVGRDRHGGAPLLACQAGAQSVSQPSVPEYWVLLANDGKQLTPK